MEELKPGQKLTWELDSREFRNALREGDASTREAVSEAAFQALSQLDNTFGSYSGIAENDELEELITDRIIEALQDATSDKDSDNFDAEYDAEHNKVVAELATA